MTPYKNELSKIGYDKEMELISKTRPQVQEMGKPLRKSSESMTISFKNSEGKRFSSTITTRDIDDLSGNSIDEKKSVLEGSLKAYDKETGWGKIRTSDSKKIITFLVKRSLLRKQLHEVTEAMEADIVAISGHYVRDQNKVIKYMIFDEYLGNADT